VTAPQFVIDTILQKKYGFRDHKWYVELYVPGGITIAVIIQVPPGEVWLVRGYDFEVQQLDSFEISHYHDGKPQIENLILSESTLELHYTGLELVERVLAFYIKNLELGQTLWIRIVAHHRIMPREIYLKIYESV